MAQGTGFNVPRGAASTPLTDMSGMAAGDIATAEALAQAGESIGRFQQRVLSPLVEDQARKDAARVCWLVGSSNSRASRSTVAPTAR